jgi:hypothetical protein
MTIYISQGRYTAAAIKGMSAKPEDRSEAVAELFAAAGARLISWYLTLGPYDWLIIAEALDERRPFSVRRQRRGDRPRRTSSAPSGQHTLPSQRSTPKLSGLPSERKGSRRSSR